MRSRIQPPTRSSRSAAALDNIAGWPEDQIDALITALAAQIAAHAEKLAAATVAETGIGCVPDKADKNRFASLGVARSMTGRPGAGVASSGGQDALTEVAEPMGVIVGLTPVTNPVATLVFKAVICIKARDAPIASCHRATCVTCAADIIEMLSSVSVPDVLVPDPGSAPLPGPGLGPGRRSATAGTAPSRDDLDGDSARVLDAFPSRGGAGPATIAAEAGVDLDTVLSCLGLLAGCGFIERCDGGWRLRRPASSGRGR
jgi:hypothetical protein